MQASNRGFGGAVLLVATAWLACVCVCPSRRLAANGGSSARAAYLARCPQPILEDCPGRSLYWHDPCEVGADPCQPDPWCLGGHQGMSPCWYASNELLALYRYQDSVPFQSLPELNNNGSIVLESSDADSGFAGGMRVLIGRSFGDGYRMEGSYFGSHSWSDTAAVRNDDANALGGTGNLFSPFSNFGNAGGVAGLDFNTFASIDFSSTLNNAEINIRRRIGHPCGGDVCGGPPLAEASVLIGLRYTRVRENLNYFSEANVPAAQGATNSAAVSTDNDMFGVQIGWLSQFSFHRRTWIDFEVKGVVFANQAGQRTSYSNVDNNGVVTAFSDGDGQNVASFMIDLSLMLNYQFAHSWTLRTGYNGLFLMGAALASDNFNTDVNTLLLGPAHLSHSGSITYHGPSIALVWTR